MPKIQYRVLMVCLGNICRSPTAEAVLRRKLQDAGLGGLVEVDSAGTGDWHVGKGADDRAQAAGAGRGYDLSAHRARQIHPDDFDDFDLICAMDKDNLGDLLMQCPKDQKDHLSLLMDQAAESEGGRAGEEVPDPYYGGDQGFEIVLDMIEEACADIVLKITKQLQSSSS